MTREITQLRDDVRALTEVATRCFSVAEQCFNELQVQGAKIRDLEREVEQLKAQITLMQDSERETPTRPDNDKPAEPAGG